MKTNKLTGLKVHFISLVKRGANRRSIVWKSDKGPGETLDSSVRLVKTDEEKRIVYGVVYAPEEIDSQGDWTTADEIEKAAHSFLRTMAQHHVDVEHDFAPVEGVYVAESWVLCGEDSRFKKEREGSWVVGIKVEDDDTWNAVKNGDVQGISMAGTAKRTLDSPPIKKSDDTGVLKKIINLLKTQETRMDKKEMQEALENALKPVTEKIDALEKAAKERDKTGEDKNGSGDKTDAVADALKSISDRLDAIEKSSKGTKQGDAGAPDDVSEMLKRMSGEE